MKLNLCSGIKVVIPGNARTGAPFAPADGKTYGMKDLQWVPISSSIPDTGDGRQVELQATATHIQWRYVGDPTWINLIDLSELQGAPGYTPVEGEDYDDGREIELQTTETHIQWRYVGETSWNNLITLSEITGAAGKSVELQATATHIQWRQIGDSEWTDIVPLSTLKGADGTNITITATTDPTVFDNATPSATELVVLYDA